MSPKLEALKKTIKEKSDFLDKNKVPFKSDSPIREELQRALDIIEAAKKKDECLIESNEIAKKHRLDDLNKQINWARESISQSVYANEAAQVQIKNDIDNYQTQMDTIDRQTDIVKPRTLHFELLYAAYLMKEAINSNHKLNGFEGKIDLIMNTLKNISSLNASEEIPAHAALLDLNKKLQDNMIMVSHVSGSEGPESALNQPTSKGSADDTQHTTANPPLVTSSVTTQFKSYRKPSSEGTQKHHTEPKSISSFTNSLEIPFVTSSVNTPTPSVEQGTAPPITPAAQHASVKQQASIKAVVQGELSKKKLELVPQIPLTPLINLDPEQIRTFESLFRESVKSIPDYKFSLTENKNTLTVEHSHKNTPLPPMAITPDGTIRSSVPIGDDADTKMRVLAETIVAAHIAHLALSGEKMTEMPTINCKNDKMSNILKLVLNRAFATEGEVEQQEISLSPGSQPAGNP